MGLDRSGGDGGENGHGMDGDGMGGPEEIAATTGDHDLASAEGSQWSDHSGCHK